MLRTRRARRVYGTLATQCIAHTVLCPTGAYAHTSSRTRLIARIDSIANAAVKAGPVAGLSVAVVKGRDTLVQKGYGFADVENDVRATAQTVYRIGSVTKQFTSAAIMQLVEQGKIGLDDEITKYLPDFPTRGQRILVRHLLNHTSGIPSYTDVPRFGRVGRMDLAHDSLLAIVANDSLMFEPGSHFYYNNTGYYMLGMILEKVTGRPYGEYLAEHLFAPLGLRSTLYCSTAPIVKHRAQGYGAQRGQLVNAEYISMDLPYAAGSLCSTVGDLVRWTAALSSGKVVSPSSYQQMTTPVSLTSGRDMSYGFGLSAGKNGTHRYIGHGGGINGFISYLVHYPDDSLYIAVLANTSPAPSTEVADNIARTIFGMPLRSGPEPRTELATTAEERAKYVGSYSMVQPDGTRRTVRVAEENGALVLQPEGQRAMRLVRHGENTFGIAGQASGRVLFDVSGGKATGFQIDRGARPLEATRIP
jgi:CubicO group peptidase (beta-lactamase class C family)